MHHFWIINTRIFFGSQKIVSKSIQIYITAVQTKTIWIQKHIPTRSIKWIEKKLSNIGWKWSQEQPQSLSQEQFRWDVPKTDRNVRHCPVFSLAQYTRSEESSWSRITSLLNARGSPKTSAAQTRIDSSATPQLAWRWRRFYSRPPCDHTVPSSYVRKHSIDRLCWANINCFMSTENDWLKVLSRWYLRWQIQNFRRFGRKKSEIGYFYCLPRVA